MVYAPGRDSIPDANGTVEYNPARGAGGVFANFMQGMTAKYADNTRGYRTDFYRNTLARLFVRVDTSEMNLFLGSISDEHTKDQLVPRLVGDPTRRQADRLTGGGGTGDSYVQSEQTPSHNGYLDFFIQQASMPLQEKVDVKETLSDNYVAYFFGQSPPMWTFSGWLFNSVQDDQATNFLRLYLEILRGTQLARRQKVVSLKIDSYIITGAIVAANFQLNAQSETVVPLTFQLLVKRVATVNYTSGWVPTRASTPFAADPNAIPYDGRRMRSGARAAVVGLLAPQRASAAAPVPAGTADSRVTQPPAPTDPVTQAASGQVDMNFVGDPEVIASQARQEAIIAARRAAAQPSTPNTNGPVTVPLGTNDAAARRAAEQLSQGAARSAANNGSGQPETLNNAAPSPSP